MESIDRRIIGINVRRVRPDGSTSMLVYAKVVACDVPQAMVMLREHPRFAEADFLTRGKLQLEADGGEYPGAKADQEPILVFERPRKRVRRCVLQLVAHDEPALTAAKQWEVRGSVHYVQQWDGGMEITIEDPNLLLKAGEYVLLNMDDSAPGVNRLIRGRVVDVLVEHGHGTSRKYRIQADVRAPITDRVDHILTFPNVRTIPPLRTAQVASSATALQAAGDIWKRRANSDLDRMLASEFGLGSKWDKQS